MDRAARIASGSLVFTLVALLVAPLGCGNGVTDNSMGIAPDAPAGDAGGPPTVDAGADAPASDITPADAPGDTPADAPGAIDAPSPPDALAACLASGCPAAQVCCAATGACYDPSCLSCCPVAPPDGGTAADTVSVVDAVPTTDAPPAADVGATACADTASCGARRYCAGDTCGAAGTCAARPTTCSAVVDPVCGCDDRTYPNACDAAAAGVRVASRGHCPLLIPDAGPDAAPDAGTDAGPGACRTNAACAATDYCAGTGCDTPGTCTARTRICPLIVSPVCGCDGNTYGNNCLAARAGVRVATRGACASACPTCAAGLVCCAATGRCYNPRCLGCCMVRFLPDAAVP